MRTPRGFELIVAAALVAATGCTFDAAGLPANEDSAWAPDLTLQMDKGILNPDVAPLDQAPRLDGNAPDAAQPDAFVPDAFVPDALVPDAFVPDVLVPDALVPDALVPDMDGDGVPDSVDNCPQIKNPLQDDLDKDGLGDACDPDKDGDTLPDGIDPDPLVANTVSYYKTANLVAGDSYRFGTGWYVKGDAWCQSKDGTQNYRTRLRSQVGGNDYVVETRFAVSSSNPTKDWPAAGITFRADSVGSGNFDGYVCLVDLDNLRLVLGSYNNSSWTRLDETTNKTVPANGPYRLRATAKGSTLSCELIGASTPVLTVTNTTHSSGTAGFYTDQAKVCFEYLMVLPAP